MIDDSYNHPLILFQEYVNRGKHSFLPLTRLDHRQHDAEFEAAFDVEYIHKNAPVRINFVHIALDSPNTNSSYMYDRTFN